jgi:hypothetical protein
MNNEMFAELLESVREGGAILRGEREASRRFEIEAPDVRLIRERFDLSQSEFADYWRSASKRSKTGNKAGVRRVAQRVCYCKWRRDILTSCGRSSGVKHFLTHVVDFAIVGPYRLNVVFDDAAEQTIDFEPVLHGYIYGPLRNLELFNQVRLDPEVHTLVWPNDADFDPATLCYWNDGDGVELAERARGWERAHVASGAGE